MDMSGAPAFEPQSGLQPAFEPQVPPQVLDEGRKMLYVLSGSRLRFPWSMHRQNRVQ